MTRDELQNYLDLYSADLSRWPLDKVKPALALIEQDPAAKADFDQALALDDVLRRGMADVDLGIDLAALEARITGAVAGLDTKPDMTVEDMPVDVLRPAVLGRMMAALVFAAFLGFMTSFGVRSSVAADPVLDPVLYTPDIVIAGDDNLFILENEVLLNEK